MDNSFLLTVREEEILSLLAEGLRYEDIAFRLNISIETVRKHASNIYAKMKVKNRVQALIQFGYLASLLVDLITPDLISYIG